MHIRGIFSICGAYTGHFFAYTEHIRGIFSIYGAYTGHFFAYTEHIRGILLHIRSIYGALFCIYGAFFLHIRRYTCIYGMFLKKSKIYFGRLRSLRIFLLTDL